LTGHDGLYIDHDRQTYRTIRNLARIGPRGKGLILSKFSPGDIKAAYAKVSANYNLNEKAWTPGWVYVIKECRDAVVGL
jgi:hypothetical protein